MTRDPTALYTALQARDPRFDGVFYVGVTSTGIYCRPICTAKTPKAANCRFFDTPAAAEQARFRPCLRCRPELAPGHAPVDDARRIAHLVAARIEEGLSDGARGLGAIAARFGWSSRHLRRLVKQELGVSPIELALTRRLLLAKQLLTDTALPVTEVAFASGFSSLRRFNDAFLRRYGMPPTRLRKATEAPAAAAETLTLPLGYRPPFDWDALLDFLGTRAVAGVEVVADGRYHRTVKIGAHTGWVSVRNAPQRRSILVELPHELTPVLPALLGRLRQLFDLGARPDLIVARLGQDPLLAASVARHPGLRVPGAFDGFEIVLRAVLGQQVTVATASRLTARVVAAYGERIAGAPGGLDCLTPSAERVAGLRAAEVAGLGIVRTRAACLVAVATEVAAGRIRLEPGPMAGETLERLLAVPGIGPWTARYIAMRALGWPDAFLTGDAVVRNRLGGLSPRLAEERSEPWRPWRSYATLHLWKSEPAPRSPTAITTRP